MSNTKRNIALSLLLGAALVATADDGSSLWLRKPAPDPAMVKS